MARATVLLFLVVLTAKRNWSTTAQIIDRYSIRLDLAVTIDSSDPEKSEFRLSTIRETLIWLGQRLKLSARRVVFYLGFILCHEYIMEENITDFNEYLEHVRKIDACNNYSRPRPPLSHVMVMPISMLKYRMAVDRLHVGILIVNRYDLNKTMQLSFSDLYRQRTITTYVIYVGESYREENVVEIMETVTGYRERVFAMKTVDELNSTLVTILNKMILSKCSDIVPECVYLLPKARNCSIQFISHEHSPVSSADCPWRITAQRPTCSVQRCEEFCDRHWPWSDEKICICGAYQHRPKVYKFPNRFVRNCPHNRPCTMCDTHSLKPTSDVDSNGGDLGISILLWTIASISLGGLILLSVLTVVYVLIARRHQQKHPRSGKRSQKSSKSSKSSRSTIRSNEDIRA